MNLRSDYSVSSFDDYEAISVLRKVRAFNEKTFSELVSPRKP